MNSRQPKRFPTAPWIIGLLLVVLGYALAFLLDGAAPSLLVQTASKDWPSTTGVITHSDVIEESSVDDDSSYRADIRAHYQVDRKKYRLYEIYPGHSALGSSSNIELVRLSSRYRVGKSVPVYFNPLDPGEAVLETGVHGRTLFILAFAIVPAALGVWLLLWAIRDTSHWIGQLFNKRPNSPLHADEVAIVDPIEHADLKVAYGLYEDAVRSLNDAIEKEPARPDLILKLLEVHLASDDDAAFIAAAKKYRNRLSASDWAKVQQRGNNNV
ncbi:MAG: DUF3592 domain-containing protein [Gammaproteobacteria bacterium]|nr:DUF3592 domain-containing protein [Gammaproteobacteria bacterium]